MLHIDIDDLINARSVESERLEFKASCSSEQTKAQIAATACAFANDFFEINGGYIVIGITEKDHQPVLPPVGLKQNEIDTIQKELRGVFKRIEPEYIPRIVAEMYQGQSILVLWCPAGEIRPYQALGARGNEKDKRYYYIRQGSETVKAQQEILTQLMQKTARIPYDDRRNLNATLETLSPTLVRNHLNNIKSRLVHAGSHISDYELYQTMNLVNPVNNHYVPKNVALMFFCDNPEKYFPGMRIEVAQFADDAGGNLIEEKIFTGPLQVQLRDTLRYLNSLSTTFIQKLPSQAESIKTVIFPYQAMEETIVNAVYHRDYEGKYSNEPIKIYLYPDRMVITSYPGPVAGLRLVHFTTGKPVPQVPNRNRRIGEFLKELRLAESKYSGIPTIWRKMSENGSPAPQFDFDDATRTYFSVTLPAHPQYVILHALRESALLWTQGERQRAMANLKIAKQTANTGHLSAKLIEYCAELGNLAEAQHFFTEVQQNKLIADRHLAYSAWAKVLLDHNDTNSAIKVLKDMPSPTNGDEQIELALLHKRAHQFQTAHRIFLANYDLFKDNPKALQEYAQTKNQLAGKNKDQYVRQRLNGDAAELLRRAIQLSDDYIRNAWCWFDLAKTLSWLNKPDNEVMQAYEEAIKLLPDEVRFQRGYSGWKQRKKTRANSKDK